MGWPDKSTDVNFLIKNVRLWMPFSGTWVANGTPNVTGVTDAAHLYAVGDKIEIPPSGSGNTVLSGTALVAGTYTVTASATPNYTMTKDTGGNIATGNGTLNGTTSQVMYTYTVGGGLMRENDKLCGEVAAFYGSGSTSGKTVQLRVGGNFYPLNTTVNTAGIAGHRYPWAFNNRGVLDKQFSTQVYANNIYYTDGSIANGAVNTANNFDIVVYASKTTGTDAVCIDFFTIDLQRY